MRKYNRGWVQQPSLWSNKLQMITVYFDALGIPPTSRCGFLPFTSWKVTCVHTLCLCNEPLPLRACLNMLFILHFLFGLSSALGSRAAATTLRGPTLLPQPLWEKGLFSTPFISR